MYNYVFRFKVVRYAIQTSAIVIALFILLRLTVHSEKGHNKEHNLKVILALCRIGLIFIFCLLFLPSIVQKKTYHSVIHNYAYYTYPMILVSYLVVKGAYWSVGSFMYISREDLIDMTLPCTLISWAVGLFLGLILDFRTLYVK